MTQDRVQEIYQEIGTLGSIPLDPSPELGPSYLLGKLQECRRQQDRTQTLMVETHRALSAAKQAKRILIGKRHLYRGQAEKAEERYRVEQELETAENRVDEVQALERVLSVVRGNLKATDSDIRLAARLLDTQLRLGQIMPPHRDQPVASPLAEPARPLPQVEDQTKPAAVGQDEAFYRSMEGL